VGLLGRFRRRRGPETAAETDRLALAQLASRGADLTRPRHVVHVLAFADEAAARVAAAEVARGGYETAVRPTGEGTAQWSVRAEAQRVVDATTVPGFRAWFERIAAAHGGRYEGWEAARKP
jgi:hypothetical protein